MKIVCESCQAKYSISDDKVRGKVFKIRCKKCSHVIVVRGADDAAADAAPAVAAESAGAISVWHIVVDGEQVGPMSEADLRGRLSRGEITAETYIWKEGQADWLKLSAVAEFGDAAAAVAAEPAPYASAPSDEDSAFSAPPPTAIYPPGTAENAFSSSGSQGTDDLFSAPPAASFAAPGVSSTGQSSPAGDLFASPAASPVDSDSASPSMFSFGGASGAHAQRHGANGSGPVAAAAAAKPDGLHGQRHENSVLFSLSNLESLSAPGAGSMAPLARPAGAAGGAQEGSGLIDIRAMAAMTMGGGSGAGAGASHSPYAPTGNDLPNFGAPQFSPVAPVLLSINPSSGPSKAVYLALGLLGVIVVGMTVVIYKMMNTPAPIVLQESPAPSGSSPLARAAAAPVPGATTQSAATPGSGSAPVAAAATAAPGPSEVPATVPVAKTAEPAAAEVPAPVAKHERGAHGKSGRSGKGDKKGGGRAASGTASVDKEVPVGAAAPRAEKASAEPAEKAPAKGSIDDLLASAMGSKPKPAARPRAEEEDTSAKKAAAAKPLEKEDLVKGMMPVMPKIHECFSQYKVPGIANVNISVAKSGKVSSASVSGKFAGTPSGVCVENAVKSAKFVASDGLNFTYPVSLR